MTANGNTNGTLTSNRAAMDRFLARLRDSGNVRMSCLAAGVPRQTAYNWRKRWVTFAAEWDEALEDACDILEAEAWKRAVKEKSDRLLMFLLKAHRPDRYKERAAVDLSGSIGIHDDLAEWKASREKSQADIDAMDEPGETPNA